MRIFLYEWVTGGGLLAHEGPMLQALVTKGLTMVQAAGQDLAALPNTQVTLLRDLRVPQLAASGCKLEKVDGPASHNEAFQALCRDSDAVMLIAPETDGVLLNAVRDAEQYGAKLISPGSDFVKLASDKHLTAQRLLSAGVPAPEGVVLESDETLPPTFPYPAVLKPVDGAGSQDTMVVASHHESPPAYAWPRRLERYLPGTPASVGVLCGPAGNVPLCPTYQNISTDGCLKYLGGSLPLRSGLAKRATSLALATIDALPTAVGYVGVDLVLGANPDGSEDAVIEVNPRLSTSYAGVRFSVQQNLAAAILAVAQGEQPELTFDSRPMEFGADGVVNFCQE